MLNVAVDDSEDLGIDVSILLSAVLVLEVNLSYLVLILVVLILNLPQVSWKLLPVPMHVYF